MRLFILIAFIFLSPFSLSKSYGETITIVADYWCPYNCDTKGDRPGYMVEIAKLIFGKQKIKVKYQIVNWSRAIYATRKGRYNGVIGAFRGDVPDFIFPGNELGVSFNNFYINKKTLWTYRGDSSLTEHRIGVIKNYSYGKRLDRYIMKNFANSDRILMAYGSNALVKLVELLRLGKIHSLVEDKYVWDYHIRNNKYKNNFKIAGQIHAQKAYIAFTPRKKSSAKYASILSAGIAEIRKSGELQKILDRYGLKDWYKSGFDGVRPAIRNN